MSADRITVDGTVEVRATVENVGERVGEEVVQFYLHDDVSSVIKPVRERCGFERVRLAPGNDRTVTVRLGPEELAVIHDDGRSAVPGAFTVTCADRSVSFDVTTG